MTDLIPNDLSHMSDADFNALCPQGHHAPGPEPLSLAAQAVLDAFRTSHTGQGCLAAALRAVADQVVPWQPEPTEDSVGPTIDYGYAWALFSKANDIRQELIAIADELEGFND